MEYFFYHKDGVWGKHNYWEVLSECRQFLKTTAERGSYVKYHQIL